MTAKFASAPQLETDRGSGRVTAVHGSVVDIAFGGGVLPAINHAVEIDWDFGPPLIAEVQQHVGPAMVRAVALGSTGGCAVARPREPLARRSLPRLAMLFSGVCSTWLASR